MLLRRLRIRLKYGGRFRAVSESAVYPAPRRKKIGFVLICAAVFIVAVIIYASICLKPIVRSMAENTATDEITLTINKVISEKILAGNFEYSNLVTLEKDDAGRVTALRTNMAVINALKTEITNDIIERVTDVMETDMSVPLGSIIGGSLLSGRGPGIPVRILTVTNSNTDFKNQFTSVGINQTRHQIILRIELTADILIPGSIEPDFVSTDVVIAETIIVGAVPNAYANFDGIQRQEMDNGSEG